MNDDPEMYRKYSIQNQIDNVLFLDRYKLKMKWRQSGDRSIDLGCGDGGMTMTLEKHLPLNYEVLVGCDVNRNMLRFASETYATDRIKFHEMDIAGDVPNDWRGSFHHVFSFYALQWIQDQKKAFGNIYELLAPGGDCLLLIPCRHYVYNVFLALSAMDKWAPYVKNVDKFISPYYDCQEPDKKVQEMMEEIGFTHVEVQCKQMIGTCTSLESLKNFTMAINPFSPPSDLTNDMMGDMDAVLRGLGYVRRAEDGRKIIKYSYNLLVVYATK